MVKMPRSLLATFFTWLRSSVVRLGPGRVSHVREHLTDEELVGETSRTTPSWVVVHGPMCGRATPIANRDRDVTIDLDASIT